MLIIRPVLLMMISVVLPNAHALVLNDPTRPVILNSIASVPVRLASSTDLKLSVIKLYKNQNIAVINNRVYREGQRIGQDKIIKIIIDKVILSSGKELHLFGHSVVNISK